MARWERLASVLLTLQARTKVAVSDSRIRNWDLLFQWRILQVISLLQLRSGLSHYMFTPLRDNPRPAGVAAWPAIPIALASAVAFDED